VSQLLDGHVPKARRRTASPGLGWGEDDTERRALAGGTRDPDFPPEALDRAMRDRQAEARALEALCGEKGIEDPREILARNPRPCVGDLDDGVAMLVGARRDTHFVAVCLALGDGLRRVDQQTQKDLAEPSLVRVDEGNLCENFGEAGAVTDLVPRHLGGALKDAPQVDQPVVLRVSLSEDQ
jgi:hypothetical protein